MNKLQFNEYQELAQFLTEYRKAHNISQVELAKRASITQAQVSKYENQVIVASPDLLFSWINGLGLQLNLSEKENIDGTQFEE